jgi:HD superfamily phosphodiesterase
MVENLVLKARALLSENPYDSLHATSHHQQVWDNCLRIVNEEGLVVDTDVLRVAAWWHDVERGSEEAKLLKDALREVGASQDFGQRVMEVIGGHSFGQDQGSLEARVLYDADKLEYLSIERAESLLRDFENGTIGTERFVDYKSEWAKRIKLVRGSLHFESSRARFDGNLKGFIEHAKSNPELAEFVSAVI